MTNFQNSTSSIRDTFPVVCVLGGGVLGGSIARALAQRDPSLCVRLWSRREESTAEAIKMGITGATSDLSEAVAEASLVILCVPVGVMPSLLESAMLAGLPRNALITDVGSVKQFPHIHLKGTIRAHGLRFVGSHPMAGSEQAGITHARAALFENAACIMTNDEGADEATQLNLEKFWKKLGCRTSWLTAAEHDAIVAQISHVPHIFSALASRICLKTPEFGSFGGGGLRDTTRVAGGNPAMWQEILLENHAAIYPMIEQAIAEMQEFSKILASKDAPALQSWLEHAKELRDTLSQKSIH